MLLENKEGNTIVYYAEKSDTQTERQNQAIDNINKSFSQENDKLKEGVVYYEN